MRVLRILRPDAYTILADSPCSCDRVTRSAVPHGSEITFGVPDLSGKSSLLTCLFTAIDLLMVPDLNAVT